MMKKLGVPLIVLAVLVVVALLLEGPCARKSMEPVLKSPLKGVKIEDVVGVEISKGDAKVRLEKREDRWCVLIDSAPYRADSQKVAELLDKISGIRGPVVSRNPAKQGIFEVEEGKGIEVTLLGPDEKVLSRFIIGKTTPDFTSSYVRGFDSDEVIQAEGYLSVTFSTDPKRWRNRRLLFFDKENVARLELFEEDGKLIADRSEDGTWTLLEPSGESPDTAKLRSVVSTLSRLFAAGFDDTLTFAQAGLDKPAVIARVTLADGSEQEVRVGSLKHGDDTKYYASVPDDETVYTVAKWSIERFKKPVKEFLVEEADTTQ